VVIVDFGLVTDLGAPCERGVVVGTPHYMSPEQAAGGAVSEASDWYSFGVILYQALSGTLPFLGSTCAIIEQKCMWDPPPVPSRPDGADDLAALCMALLARDPGARPGGREVLTWLGGGLAPAPALCAA
jgi:serine/threonine protein kinase